MFLPIVLALAVPGSLIVNGSFEAPSAGASFVPLFAGSDALPGWTITGVSIDVVGPLWQQVDGAQSLDMDGTPGPGGIEQSFATTPGEWYAVTFMMAANVQCPPLPGKALEVSAAGQSTVLTFDSTGHTFADMGWAPRQWCFRAVNGTTTLALSSESPGAGLCGAVLDLVEVEPTVAPILGDLNCDGLVNGSDLGILLGAWGSCGDICLTCLADLTGNCVVDGADLGILLGNWTG